MREVQTGGWYVDNARVDGYASDQIVVRAPKPINASTDVVAVVPSWEYGHLIVLCVNHQPTLTKIAIKQIRSLCDEVLDDPPSEANVHTSGRKALAHQIMTILNATR